MEDAVKCHTQPFDIVFNRVCWNYGFADRGFAGVFFDLVKPGGAGYVDTAHSGAGGSKSSWSVRARTWLNDSFAIKIGHPLPPHGRIAELFMKKPIAKMLVDYSSGSNDRVLFIRR